MRNASLAVLLGLGASGCASADNRWAEDVDSWTRTRGVSAPAVLEAQAGLARAVDEMIARPLDEENAVRIALANNAGLKATYAELDLSSADLAQAGLLRNPSVAGHLGFSSGGQKEIELNAAQDLISLLSAPLRRRLSARRFQQAKLQVADAVLRLASDTRGGFYAAQAAEQVLGMRRTARESARAAAELSERQRQAGNVSVLEDGAQQALAERSEIDALRAEAESAAARERLNVLMGLNGAQAGSWRIATELPELPGADPSLEELQARASAQRLDLEAARLEVDISERLRSLARFSLIPEAAAGIDWHREPEENASRKAAGPSLELSLPLFDRGQNARAGARARLSAAKHRLSALEAAIQAELRAVHGRLGAARRIAERYRDRLVPLRERLAAEAQRHYNFMLIGVYHLLEIKVEEIGAKREYAEALRDYWTARAELERAAGGQLAGAAPARRPERSQGEDHEHRH